MPMQERGDGAETGVGLLRMRQMAALRELDKLRIGDEGVIMVFVDAHAFKSEFVGKLQLAR